MIIIGGPGRYYLNYIGATIRFMAFWFWSKINSTQVYGYQVFLRGPLNENVLLEEDEYYPRNIYVGILTLVVLVFIVVSLDL